MKIAPPKPSGRTPPAPPRLILKLRDILNKGLDGMGLNPLKGPATQPREVDLGSERRVAAGEADRKALQMDYGS